MTEIAPAHFTPSETVLYNARLKAAAVALQFPETLVLGVDTLVAFEGRILGKPRDWAEAEWMLGLLNGCWHEVFSGVSLIAPARGKQLHFVETTRVCFRTLTEGQRRAYLQRIGPLDKAGAYAAQDDNGEMIERFEGSFSNVIGLPMEALAPALHELLNAI